MVERADEIAYQIAKDAVTVDPESPERSEAIVAAQAAIDQLKVISQAAATGDFSTATDQLQDLQEYAET